MAGPSTRARAADDTGPWSKGTREIRIPVARTSAKWEAGDLSLYRSGAIEQLVVDVPAWDALGEFLAVVGDASPEGALVKALAAAKLVNPDSPAATHATCGHCGAQAQPIGQPCRYCGSRERKEVSAM